MSEATDDKLGLWIDGELHTVDADDLEIWEVELLEETCGCAIEAIDFNRAKAMRVLVYLVKRRHDPEFTMDQARHVKFGQLGEPDPAADGDPAADAERTAAAAATEPTKPKPRKRPTKAAQSG